MQISTHLCILGWNLFCMNKAKVTLEMLYWKAYHYYTLTPYLIPCSCLGLSLLVLMPLAPYPLLPCLYPSLAYPLSLASRYLSSCYLSLLTILCSSTASWYLSLLILVAYHLLFCLSLLIYMAIHLHFLLLQLVLPCYYLLPARLLYLSC